VNFENWYEYPEGEAHEAIYEWYRRLSDEQRDIYERHLRCAWLYNNQPLIGSEYEFAASGLTSAAVTENAIESVVDTATSMIAKNRPIPKFRTINGGFKAQRRNRLKSMFYEAEFERLKIHDNGPDIFRDGCVVDLGCWKTGKADGKVTVERVVIDELLWDERAARSRPPRAIAHVRMVDRDVLKAQYPDFADAIDKANRGEHRRLNSFRRLQDNEVLVIHITLTPSQPGAGDGREVVALQNATLLDQEWKRDYHPYVFYRWSKRMTGFYGRGLCEQLAGAQLRVNKLNRFIALCQDLIAVPRVFMHLTDAALKQRFTNELGKIYVYQREKPVVDTPQAVSAEVYSYKDALVRWMYQAAGVSEFSAQSQRIPGIEAAAAYREVIDSQSQRFAIQHQRYEAMFKELALQFDDLYKEILSDGGEPVATYNRDGISKEIAYADCHEDGEECTVIIEAASITSRSPAGRLQSVIEMAQANLIDQDEARRLMGHPDVERATSLYNAAIDDADALVEDLLEGIYRAPETFQNLELCLKRVQMAYLKARREDAPEDILQTFRDWMEAAQMAMQPPAPPAMPPGDPMMADPMAGPPPTEPGMPPPAAPLPPEVPEQMPLAA
jgi:hypothetical protein